MIEIHNRTPDHGRNGTEGCRRTVVVSGFPISPSCQGDDTCAASNPTSNPISSSTTARSNASASASASASISMHSLGRIPSFSEHCHRNSPRPERLVLPPGRNRHASSSQLHQQYHHLPTSPLSTTSSIRSSTSPSSPSSGSPSNKTYLRERKRTPPLFTSTPLFMRMNPAPVRQPSSQSPLPSQGKNRVQRPGKSSPCTTPCLSPSTEMDSMEITSDEIGGTPCGSVVREAGIRRGSGEEHQTQPKAIKGIVDPERDVEEKKSVLESGSVSLLTAMMQEQRKKDHDRSRPSSSNGPRDVPAGQRGLDADPVSEHRAGSGPSSIMGPSMTNTPKPILVGLPGTTWQTNTATTSTTTSMANSLARRSSPPVSPGKRLAGCSILRKPSDKWFPGEAGGSHQVHQVERPASPTMKAMVPPVEEMPVATPAQAPMGPRKSSLTFAVVPPTTGESALQRKVSDGKNGSTSVTFKSMPDDAGAVRRVMADQVIMEDEDEDEEEEGKDAVGGVRDGEETDEDVDEVAFQAELTAQRSRDNADPAAEQDENGTIKDGSFDRQTDVSDEYDDDEEDNEEEDDEEEDEEEEEDDDGSVGGIPHEDSYDANLSEQPTPMSEVVDSMSETDGDEDEEEDDENIDDLDLNVNGTASGYEEDSEAGFSSDDSIVQLRAFRSGLTKTLGRSPRPTKFKLRDGQRLVEEEGVKETKFVSPRGRRGLYHVRRGRLVMEERDVSHASPRERRLSSRAQQLEVEVEDPVEASSSLRHHRYAFARPTNYRRRRPVSEAHDDIVGGSASSLISPGSFVRIGQNAQAEVERGRGAVQIQHALLPRSQLAAAWKSGNDSCTRHRSPPPRARTKPAQIGRSASDRAPPAGLSPSADRLKIKRGVSDSPRKRRARDAVGYGTDVLALGRRSKWVENDSIVEEDPSAMSAAMTTTENETTAPHPGPSALAKLSAQRGWRSDDAVFAAPTVKRQVAVKPRLEMAQSPQSRRRPGPPPSPLRPTRTMTSASSSRNESACESDQAGLSGTAGQRSASGRMVNGMISVLRRASGSVQPYFKSDGPGGRGLGSPIDAQVGSGGQAGMTLGIDTASLPRPCEVAIDMTPALGIKADPCRSSAPAQQVLHQTLNSRSSSPWSPMMSSDEQFHDRPGSRGVERSGDDSRPGSRSGSGYMTEPVKVSFTDPGRRGSQPEVRVTSRPIQCPLPKRAVE